MNNRPSSVVARVDRRESAIEFSVRSAIKPNQQQQHRQRLYWAIVQAIGRRRSSNLSTSAVAIQSSESIERLWQSCFEYKSWLLRSFSHSRPLELLLSSRCVVLVSVLHLSAPSPAQLAICGPHNTPSLVLVVVSSVGTVLVAGSALDRSLHLPFRGRIRLDRTFGQFGSRARLVPVSSVLYLLLAWWIFKTYSPCVIVRRPTAAAARAGEEKVADTFVCTEQSSRLFRWNGKYF